MLFKLEYLKFQAIILQFVYNYLQNRSGTNTCRLSASLRNIIRSSQGSSLSPILYSLFNSYILHSTLTFPNMPLSRYVGRRQLHLLGQLTTSEVPLRSSKMDAYLVYPANPKQNASHFFPNHIQDARHNGQKTLYSASNSTKLSSHHQNLKPNPQTGQIILGPHWVCKDAHLIPIYTLQSMLLSPIASSSRPQSPTLLPNTSPLATD